MSGDQNPTVNHPGGFTADTFSPPPLIDPFVGFVLFTNGKCANTTQKHWFFSSSDMLDLMAGRKDHPVLPRRRWSLAPWTARRLIRRYGGASSNTRVRPLADHYRATIAPHFIRDAGFHDLPKFMVTRDPAARALSGYLDKFCGEDHATAWVKKIAAAIGNTNPTFAEFLDYLQRTPAADLNGHWRPQTHFVRHLKDVRYIPLRDMGHELPKAVGDRGGRTDEILSQKTQSSRYLPDDIDGAMRLRADAIRRLHSQRGGFPNPLCFLSDPLRRQIKSIFAEDYDLLGY